MFFALPFAKGLKGQFRVFFILVVCSNLVKAQSFPNLRFTQLSVKDGLSTNAVKCSYQDGQGIIWIATSKGLNRYDGSGFKVFRHNDNDSSTICNDAAITVTADREQQLWLGTFNGLSRFNPKTGKSVNFFSGRCNPFIDSRGRLWVAKDTAVQMFDYKKNISISYNLSEEDKHMLKHSPSLILQIKEDAGRRLWAIGMDGIYQIDEQQRTLVPKDVSPAGIGIDGGVAWTDNHQNKWICIAKKEGLTPRNKQSGRDKVYTTDILNPSSLNAYNIFHIARDSQNRLWLSTDNGLCIVDPNLQYFENIPLYQQLKFNNPKIFGLPNNMIETKEYFYVTSTPAKGLYVFDKSWHLIKHIGQIPENSTSALSRAVNSIYKDDKNNFWFSTDSGLVKKDGSRYQVFLPPGADLAIKEDLTFSKIYKRKDGLFWIRARQNGIYLFDPLKNNFVKQYRPDGKHIKGAVYSCYLDKQGILWAGTIAGISRYIPSEDSFSKVKVRTLDGKECEVGWVTDITEDSNKVIWAVSDVGLLKIDRTTGNGLLIDAKSGLPEKFLKRIMVDTLGNLWIPSQQGIIKYDRKNKFAYFNINNGLPFQYEGYGFFEQDKSGDFLLGFSGFVTRFNPYVVQTNTAVPRAIFMDISVDGKAIFMQYSDQNKIIVLPSGTKIVNIHFALTNYTAPEENKYFYKIGSAGHWQQVKNGDIALGSMSGGEYPLFIKGANNDDVFSREEHLTISVLPHWSETRLFLFLCIAAVAGIVVVLWRRRIAFIRKQFLLKQQLSESELKAIRSQMNPHFIFNVLNSIESYIMDNDKRTASRLVQKFAGLSRLILENSSQSCVPAIKEWKALQLYTELEAMRFHNQFNYTFNYDPELPLQRIMVPPMLIQPLIENAIHHGLRNYPPGIGVLSITLQQEGQTLVFVVIDNGIGLKAAGLKRSESDIKKQSLAIIGIKERITAINAVASTPLAAFSIRERNDIRSGTIAKVVLPLIYQPVNGTH